MLLGAGGIEIDSLLDESFQVQALLFEFELTRLDLVDVENIVDEIAKSRAVVVGKVDHAPCFVRQSAESPAAEQPQRSHDRGQRRAQLVADGRDELRLEPLDLLALGHVADDAAEKHLVSNLDLGDCDLDVDRMAVLVAPLDVAPFADKPGLSGALVPLEVAVMSVGIWSRHQHADVLAHRFGDRVPEDLLAAAVVANDGAAPVDRDQSVDGVVDDRLQLGLALAQRSIAAFDGLLHDPERLAELADLDIGTLHRQGGNVELAVRNLLGRAHQTLQGAADEVSREHADRRQSQRNCRAQHDQGPSVAEDGAGVGVRGEHQEIVGVRRIVVGAAGRDELTGLAQVQCGGAVVLENGLELRPVVLKACRQSIERAEDRSAVRPVHIVAIRIGGDKVPCYSRKGRDIAQPGVGRGIDDDHAEQGAGFGEDGSRRPYHRLIGPNHDTILHVGVDGGQINVAGAQLGRLFKIGAVAFALETGFLDNRNAVGDAIHTHDLAPAVGNADEARLYQARLCLNDRAEDYAQALEPDLKRFPRARRSPGRESNDALDRRRARHDKWDRAELSYALGELIGCLVEPLLDALALQTANNAR